MSKMRLVMKFGGTSLGDVARVAQMADIVRSAVERGEEVIVVVSAMSGVTNALLASAQQAAEGSISSLLATRDELLRRHLEVINQLVKSDSARAHLQDLTSNMLDGFEDLCSSIFVLGELTPRGRDAVASLGERLIAPIAAAALCTHGVEAEAVDATRLIATDDVFGTANPLMEQTRAQIQRAIPQMLERKVVPVVTGFIGATRGGLVTTIGRGGSDYTATILGNVLEAGEVWIWTDVNGVLTADPRVVGDAHSLYEITYAEAAELAYFGAKVIYPKTIMPAAEKNIPIRVLNSFNSSHPGTLIVREARESGSQVKAITAIRQLSLVTVEGQGMIGVPGVAGRVFAAVASQRVSVLMISQSSSEQNICFMVESGSAERALYALEHEFEVEQHRKNIERIWACDNVVIIAVVGAGLKTTPGIAALVFTALADRAINVIALAQGSSEYNMSIVVDEKDADEAVRAIHARLGLGGGGANG